MLMRIMKGSYIMMNGLLILMAIIRILLPFYIYYGNEIVRNLNYDRIVELTSFWMVAFVPWDIIFAVSGIQSILRNEREQIFENAFKLSVFGLCVVWFMNGIGNRFQIRAPQILKQRMKKYHSNYVDKQVVDLIQSELKCCGFNNIFSWSSESVNIPKSCCIQSPCTIYTSYEHGCVNQLTDYLEKLNVWLVLVNFPIVELVASLWNCLLTDYLPAPEIIYESRARNEDSSSSSLTNRHESNNGNESKTNKVGQLSGACSEQTIHWFEEWACDDIP